MKGPKDILFLFQAPCHRIWVYIHGELYKAFCSQIALKVRPTPLYLSLSGLPALAWSACPSVRPPLHSEVYRLQDEQFQWFQCRDQSQRKEQTEGEDKRRERDRERERQKRKKREQKKDGVNAKRGHLQSFGTTVSKHWASWPWLPVSLALALPNIATFMLPVLLFPRSVGVLLIFHQSFAQQVGGIWKNMVDPSL